MRVKDAHFPNASRQILGNIMKMHFITLLFAMTATLARPASAELDQTHAAFDKILQTNVNAKGANYAALKKDPAPLDAYLKSLADVSDSEFKSWSSDQQMAMLINLYNAATLKLVADHYPVKSIKDIGGSAGPWKQAVVDLLGKKQTLDYLENNILRPNYNDPRIHFAINCASIGCPALRSSAYRPDKLSSQLDEETRAFLSATSKNRVDAKNKTLYLSPIFDWFKSDFVKKSGSVEKFIAPYLTAADKKVVLGGGLSIKSTDYSWSLNKQ